MEDVSRNARFRNHSEDWLSAVMNLALAAVTILGCLVMLETSSGASEVGVRTHMARFQFRYLLLNYLTLGAFWSVFLIICNRVWLASLLFSFVCGGISIANYYIIQFHGMPLSFQILKNFTTAMNVISEYDFSIDHYVSLLIYAILALTVLCLLTRHFTKRGKLPVRKVLIRDISLAVIGCAVIYFGYCGENPVKPSHTIRWLWTEAYYQYGYTACSVESFCQLFDVVAQPEGYSEEAVDGIEIEDGNTGANSTPDIILILNETFYDLRQITDLQTDVPYLENIGNMDNLLSGYAVVPGEGGSTNSSEYELLTSNSLQLMPGVTPFNTLDLRGANSIVSHLNALGYSTIGSHSEPEINYSRGSAYPALGFKKVFFDGDFLDCAYYYDRHRATDESLYRNLFRWYDAEPEDSPRFLYLLTIQNHGSWVKNDDRYDTVHVLNDYGEYNDEINEYLTCISQSDSAFKYLTDYYAQLDRQVIVCMVGDHAPKFATYIADPELSDEEYALRVRKVPLLIWANFELEQQELGTMSMNYVVPTLLDLAGVQLSPYYSYMLQLKKTVPILSSYGSYYDAQGVLDKYDEDDGGIYAEAVDQYFYLEYNNLQTDRKQELFDPWE